MSPKIHLHKTMLIFIWMLAALVSFPVIYLWQIETPGQENRKRNPDVILITNQIFVNHNILFFLAM